MARVEDGERAGRSVGGSPSRGGGVWLWRVLGGEWRGRQEAVCAALPGCDLKGCCLGIGWEMGSALNSFM